jgi:hypothetical protein
MKRRRVERKVREWYMEGFWVALGNGVGPDPPLPYSDAPGWWNAVRRVAYPAGFVFAEEVVAKRAAAIAATDWPRRFVELAYGYAPEVDPETMARCYAAAGIARIRPRK